MQVDQTNLWDNVTRNVNRDNSDKAIAAYQAHMPESSSVFGAKQEHFDRTAGISDKGSIDMATYQNPAKQEEPKTVARQIMQQGQQSAGERKKRDCSCCQYHFPGGCRKTCGGWFLHDRF